MSRLCTVVILLAGVGCARHAPEVRAPVAHVSGTSVASARSIPTPPAASLSVPAKALVAAALAAVPSARRALVVANDPRAVAAELRGRVDEVDEDGVAAGPGGYDLVVAPETSWPAARASLRARVADGGALVAGFATSTRTLTWEAETDGTRFAALAVARSCREDRDETERVLVERVGRQSGAPLGLSGLMRAGLRPSEPFVQLVDTSCGKDAEARREEERRVKVAGFVLRLPTGEVVIEVPHTEQGHTYVHVPSLTAELAPLATAGSPPRGRATSVDPRSLGAALHSGFFPTSSSPIVFVEGRIALRAWEESAADRDPDEGGRDYELSSARVTAKVTSNAWRAALAKYEAKVKAKLPDAFHKIEAVSAELALDGIEAPFTELVPWDDTIFFEAVRFQARLLIATRRLQRLDPVEALADWTATTLPERTLTGAFRGRTNPTAAEREGYRALFVFGGVLSHRTMNAAKTKGNTRAACALYYEAVRLLEATKIPFPILESTRLGEAALLATCDR